MIFHWSKIIWFQRWWVMTGFKRFLFTLIFGLISKRWINGFIFSRISLTQNHFHKNPELDWRQKFYFGSKTVFKKSWNIGHPIMNDSEGFQKFSVSYKSEYFLTLSRIAFGGLHALTSCINCPWVIQDHLLPSTIQSFAIMFSSNSCLKWSHNVCQTASYFCAIDGELIFIEEPRIYEEANKECNLRNGTLSKFRII